MVVVVGGGRRQLYVDGEGFQLRSGTYLAHIFSSFQITSHLCPFLAHSKLVCPSWSLLWPEFLVMCTF